MKMSKRVTTQACLGYVGHVTDAHTFFHVCVHLSPLLTCLSTGSCLCSSISGMNDDSRFGGKWDYGYSCCLVSDVVPIINSCRGGIACQVTWSSSHMIVT